MASTRSEVLHLYKALLRESIKFPSFNFRHYAIRKVKDSFRANKSLTDSIEISNKIRDAQENLEVIKRQVLIGQLYATDKLVIENLNRKRVEV